jgi:hypothetical protein
VVNLCLFFVNCQPLHQRRGVTPDPIGETMAV